MNKAYIIALFLYVVFTVGLIFSVIVWEIYKYKDCKKVGHTTIYCIFAKG